MAYPTSLPSYAGFTSSHTLSDDNHAAQHNQEQADIRAIATKLGTGSSTPASGRILKGGAQGTSSWSTADLTTDVSNVLPVANGGTGQSTQTGTGLPVAQASPTISSPTLTTPIIASFASATHNHQNSAGGGVLGAASLPALDFSIQSLSNPYKFSVYQASDLVLSSGVFTKVHLDTEQFDTNNNFDSVTNFRYVAPINGFYQISAQIGLSTSGVSSAVAMTAGLQKNGAGLVTSWVIEGTGSANRIPRVVMSRLVQLAAGDYIELLGQINEGGRSIAGGADLTFMTGFLVSAT